MCQAVEVSLWNFERWLSRLMLTASYLAIIGTLIPIAFQANNKTCGVWIAKLMSAKPGLTLLKIVKLSNLRENLNH